MKNLNHAYCYYDNRKMKTNYAQASFTELKRAYTKITSGGSLKLWLYLLHKVSGRTLYDRENNARLPYRLGIEQIERDLDMSRASIYRAFSDLQKHELVMKLKTEHQKETDNVIVFLTMPSIKIEKKDTENNTTETNLKSQNCDPRNQSISPKKGNSTKTTDLNSETMILKPQKLITPFIPHENEGEKTNKNDTKKSELKHVCEDRIGKKGSESHKTKEIQRIANVLSNIGHGMIPEIEFSNIIQSLRSNSNCSSRKTWVREAIKIHNEKIKAQSHVVNSVDTAPAQAEIIKGAAAAENRKEPTSADITALNDIMTPPYSPDFHDNLLKEGSWVLKFPILVNRLQTWIEKEKEKPSLPPTNPFTRKNPQSFIDKLTNKFTKD